MADVLAEISGVKLTVRLAGFVFAALMLILFALLRTAMNRKTSADMRILLKWMDGIGFGLLPAAAAWKAFASQYENPGCGVPEPLPLIPLLTENGKFNPCLIEAAAALLCFAGVCIWLMIRKDGLAGRGDLMMVSLSLWSGVRIVTESFRYSSGSIARYVYCTVILICLGIWMARQLRQSCAKQRAAGNMAAAALCIAMIVLTAEGTLSVGSDIGDLAVITGCAALCVLITLFCGNDSRTAGGER